MKSKFKEGDKVFVYPHGWGIYAGEQDNNFSEVEYDEETMYCNDRLISFTEYTLQGFSQERPIELPEVGEEIMVSHDLDIWKVVTFSHYKNGVVWSQKGFGYSNFKRLR